MLATRTAARTLPVARPVPRLPPARGPAIASQPPLSRVHGRVPGDAVRAVHGDPAVHVVGSDRRPAVGRLLPGVDGRLRRDGRRDEPGRADRDGAAPGLGAPAARHAAAGDRVRGREGRLGRAPDRARPSPSSGRRTGREPRRPRAAAPGSRRSPCWPSAPSRSPRSGLLLGYLLDAESAQGGMVLCFFSLAILGGLFAPLEAFPAGPRYDWPHAPLVPLREPRPVRRRRAAARPRRRRSCSPPGRSASAPWPRGATWPTSGRAGPDRSCAGATGPSDEPPMLTVGRPGGGRRRLRAPFVAATLFFTVFPFLSLLAEPAAARGARCCCVAGWAIFVVVLVALFRGGPFARPFGGPCWRWPSWR